jgi:hypothetical protein
MNNVIKARPKTRTEQFAFDIKFRCGTIEAAIAAGIDRRELMTELVRLGYIMPKIDMEVL